MAVERIAPKMVAVMVDLPILILSDCILSGLDWDSTALIDLLVFS